MSMVLLLPFVLILAMLVTVVATLLTGHRTSVVGINEHVDLVRLARRARIWLLAALAVAVLVCLAVPLLGLGGGDTASAIAPAFAGTLVVAVICLGEATFRRPMTLTRSAALHPRRLGDLVPRGWLMTTAAALAGLAATLGIGTLYGSPDDLGRAGRALTVVCDGVTHTRTPWPGSYYGAPIALATAVSVALAVATCVVIARRPSPAAESAALDTGLRRWSIAAVLQSLTLGACLTLVPVLLIMAMGARSADCAPGGYGLLATVSLIGAGMAAVLGTVALAGLCTGPGVRVDDVPPPQRGDTAPVGVPL
ncbi:hypothetical protein ASG73_15540 [Janibacter sp. Soil728]|uniref:hypothetical protein n=1 Tax=Janibacter sp. Soil728 TaxID=1736393 RepID=UPI0006FAE3EE|nr:hypothetical protein [Janibacter sp. Soil728]KRE36065.1 hypothetical protein ASG73_15540 [Janibacter sp. Soil728]